MSIEEMLKCLSRKWDAQRKIKGILHKILMRKYMYKDMVFKNTFKTVFMFNVTIFSTNFDIFSLFLNVGKFQKLDYKL